MFNTYTNNQKVSVNAVSGTLAKTCKESFFRSCEFGSPLMKTLMSSNPSIERKPVVILQAMIIGEDRMMFELIWKTDFDRLEGE